MTDAREKALEAWRGDRVLHGPRDSAFRAGYDAREPEIERLRAELALARKHACASCVNGFEQIRGIVDDPEQSDDAKVNRIRNMLDPPLLTSAPSPAAEPCTACDGTGLGPTMTEFEP